MVDDLAIARDHCCAFYFQIVRVERSEVGVKCGSKPILAMPFSRSRTEARKKRFPSFGCGSIFEQFQEARGLPPNVLKHSLVALKNQPRGLSSAPDCDLPPDQPPLKVPMPAPIAAVR